MCGTEVGINYAVLASYGDDEALYMKEKNCGVYRT